MQHVKMLAEVEDVARRAADRWYVTTGNAAVGPVNLDLLARGVEAGKVPLEAFVRHEGWKVWRPLCELAVVLDDSLQGEALRTAAGGAPPAPASLAGDPRTTSPTRASPSRWAKRWPARTATAPRGGRRWCC